MAQFYDVCAEDAAQQGDFTGVRRTGPSPLPPLITGAALSIVSCRVSPRVAPAAPRSPQALETLREAIKCIQRVQTRSGRGREGELFQRMDKVRARVRPRICLQARWCARRVGVASSMASACEASAGECTVSAQIASPLA